MCRRTQLPGLLLLAFGAGLLLGRIMGSSCIPFLLGLALISAGLLVICRA